MLRQLSVADKKNCSYRSIFIEIPGLLVLCVVLSYTIIGKVKKRKFIHATHPRTRHSDWQYLGRRTKYRRQNIVIDWNRIYRLWEEEKTNSRANEHQTESNKFSRSTQHRHKLRHQQKRNFIQIEEMKYFWCLMNGNFIIADGLFLIPIKSKTTAT